MAFNVDQSQMTLEEMTIFYLLFVKDAASAMTSQESSVVAQLV